MYIRALLKPFEQRKLGSSPWRVAAISRVEAERPLQTLQAGVRKKKKKRKCSRCSILAVLHQFHPNWILSIILRLFFSARTAFGAKFRGSLKSKEIDPLYSNAKSQHWACVVGKLLGNFIGVFCTMLDPPNAHKMTNPKNARGICIFTSRPEYSLLILVRAPWGLGSLHEIRPVSVVDVM